MQVLHFVFNMNYEIKNFQAAQNFLNEYFYNDPKYTEFLEGLKKWPVVAIPFEDLVKELTNYLNNSYQQLIIHSEDNDFNLSLRMALECLLFNNLYDIIMPLVSFQCQDEDLYLFGKCLDFAEKNVTAEQFGACEDYSFPLLAGVVELASLDNHKTPIEKVSCLCTTYDLLYAQLKSAYAEFIAETSEAENQIPIVENSDIIPVLMTVIIKAKLMHLYSNLYYINMFLWTCNDPDNVSHVMDMFSQAIERITNTTEENLRPSSSKNCKNLDLKSTLEILNETEESGKTKTISLLDQQRRKIAEQILSATMEASSS